MTADALVYCKPADTMDGALARIEGRPAPKRQKRAYESSLDEA